MQVVTVNGSFYIVRVCSFMKVVGWWCMKDTLHRQQTASLWTVQPHRLYLQWGELKQGNTKIKCVFQTNRSLFTTSNNKAFFSFFLFFKTETLITNIPSCTTAEIHLFRVFYYTLWEKKMSSKLTHKVTRAPDHVKAKMTWNQSKLLTESGSQSLLIGPHRPLDLTHRAKPVEPLRAAARNFLYKEAKLFIRPEVCTGVGRRG